LVKRKQRQLLRSKLMDVLGGVMSRKAMEWASLIDHLNWRNKIAGNPTENPALTIVKRSKFCIAQSAV
jgi:hypothetical protein